MVGTTSAHCILTLLSSALPGSSNPIASAAEETTTEPDDGRVSVGTVFFAVPANQVPDEILNVGERVNVTDLVNLNQITGNNRQSFNNRRNQQRNNNRGDNRRNQQRNSNQRNSARGQTVRGIVPRNDPGVSTIRPVPFNLRNR